MAISALDRSLKDADCLVTYRRATIAAKEFAANHGWLLFHDKVKTSQVYLHDTTLIGSLPVLLFGGELKILAKVLGVRPRCCGIPEGCAR